MISSLATFAGLLDRSVQAIAAMAADARSFDVCRIGRIADIWDNNTFPLVSAACAWRLVRARRARAGLLWMADLGAARRALMIDLDPTLDSVLPVPPPEQPVHRDFAGRVFPSEFPLTADTVAALADDYDLASAAVQSFTARPLSATHLQVNLTLAAPRRFVPSTGYVAPDGSRRPWPPATLVFNFADVSEMRFDAADRIGVAIACEAAGCTVTIGRGGSLRAASGSVWPNDPRWDETASGLAADKVTPHARRARRKPISLASLSAEAIAAARALQHLMLSVRLVHYYPDRATRIPVGEICGLTADAGAAILAAASHRRSVRAKAFAGLARQWQRVPPDRDPIRIPSGPTMLRYVGYHEPHTDYDRRREGQAVLIAAVPDADPAKPWSLAGEKITNPTQLRMDATAFGAIQYINQEPGRLAISESLAVQG